MASPLPLNAPTPLIRVSGLVKTYGIFEALKGISFEVASGEVFGLLGPNGSGKTTTIEILEGLRTRSGGTVLLGGLDPETEGFRSRALIGGQLQRTILPGLLTVQEIFRLYASFHPADIDIRETMAFVGLQEFRYHYFQGLSGGQQQRVAIGLTLLGQPKVLFLDEPTVGLDPKIRLEIHELILALRKAGKTVVLTTHYIEEAEKLCDRVAILVEGSIRAIDSPSSMIQEFLGFERIFVELGEPMEPPPYKDWPSVAKARVDGCQATLYSSNSTATLLALVTEAEKRGISLKEIRTTRPTLEDVYLKVIGS